MDMDDIKRVSYDGDCFLVSKQFVFTLSFVLLTLSRIMFGSSHLGDLLGDKSTSIISSLMLVGSLLLLVFLAFFYKFPKNEIIPLLFCTGIFGISCYRCRATNLFICFLFLYFSSVISDKRKFAKNVIVLFSTILIVLSLLSISGLIGMGIKQRTTNEALRYSMGFTHPNQVGILSFGIIAMVFYLDAGKKHHQKYFKYIICGILTVITFIATNTFSYLVLTMLLMGASFVYDTLLCRSWLSERSLKRFVRIVLIILAVVIGVIIFHIWQTPYMLKGSLKTLRTRFLLSQKYITAYGIKPFGSKIITGDDVSIPGFPSGYFYLDNGYARLFVESGLFAGILVMTGLIKAVNRLIKKSKWQYLIIMFCILVYLFNEQRMITVFYNPMLLLMRDYILPNHNDAANIFSRAKKITLSGEVI